MPYKPAPHLERITTSHRLPRWLVDAINLLASARLRSKTDLVEEALIKTYKLKEPK